MDKLPQELVHRISSYLGRNDLKNTLLLSRKFQYAAEQYSGAFSKYTLTEYNANRFLGIYGGRLFQYLRKVEFRTSVPALDHKLNELNSCRDTAAELQQMDQEFTRQIRFLFSTIQDVETHGVHGRLNLHIYTPTRHMGREKHCLHRVFTSWRIHLISPNTLPSLKSVQVLHVDNGTELNYPEHDEPPLRKVDLRILLDLSIKLPNLRSLMCNIGGDEWISGLNEGTARYTTIDWAGPRRDSRHEFGKLLSGGMALPSLRHVQLDFIFPLDMSDWMDQRLAVPNLTKPALYDPFSSSLRLLSCQLRTMKLRVVADSTLFFPLDSDGSIPFWPNLESLSVVFHMTSPSGTWYFKGKYDIGAEEGYEITEKSYPPLETTAKDRNSHSDWNFIENGVIAQYRVVPNDETLVPFLTAFAKALALMPSLKQAAIWCPLIFNVNDLHEYTGFDPSRVSRYTEGELAWGWVYVRPGAEAFITEPGEDFSTVRQIWWNVGGWRPDVDLLNLFRHAGRQQHGEALVEYWEYSWAAPGLLERGYFEEWEEGIFD